MYIAISQELAATVNSTAQSSHLCILTFLNKLLDIILSKISLPMFISFNNEFFWFCLTNSHKSRLYFLQLLKHNKILINDITSKAWVRWDGNEKSQLPCLRPSMRLITPHFKNIYLLWNMHNICWFIWHRNVQIFHKSSHYLKILGVSQGWYEASYTKRN